MKVLSFKTQGGLYMRKRFDSITKIIISTALVSSVALGTATITVPEEASAKKTNDYKYISTKINGKKVDLKARSIKKNGIYFVHSTELLNKLGVKSSFNSAKKTLKVKNGNKTITIKKGSKYAYEGKKKYTLPATLQNINGRLYIPHDIIPKVTNYKTKVTSGTLVITNKDNTFNSVLEHKNNPSVSKKIFNINASNKTLGNSYGEKDVASYNKLNKLLEPFAEKAIDYQKKYLGDASSEMKAFDDFYNKGVSYNREELSRDERVDPYIQSILSVQNNIGLLKIEGVSSKTAKKAYKDTLTVGHFMHTILKYSEHNGVDLGKINNKNDSLYGFLNGQGGNCRTDAQLLMYMHNKLGNETLGVPNEDFTHVTIGMKIDGKWLMESSGLVVSLLDFNGDEIYNLDAHY